MESGPKIILDLDHTSSVPGSEFSGPMWLRVLAHSTRH